MGSGQETPRVSVLWMIDDSPPPVAPDASLDPEAPQEGGGPSSPCEFDRQQQTTNGEHTVTTVWEIDENAPPADPPEDSLAGDEAAGELTTEDSDAILTGVELPSDAEGDPS